MKLLKKYPIYKKKAFIFISKILKRKNIKITISPKDCKNLFLNEIVNEVIKSLPNNPGGLVYIKEGDYTINDSIKITKDDVTLMGSGAGTKINLADNAGAHMILINSSAAGATLNRIKIKDLLLDGNKANQTIYSKGIYCYGNSTYPLFEITIEGCYIRNIKGNAIQLDETHRSTILNNTCHDCDGDGIVLYMSDKNSIISNKTYLNNFAGILLDSSEDNSIIGNDIQGNNNHGIEIYNNSNNNTIGLNNIDINTYYGIYLINSQENIIYGNISKNNGLDGIVITGTAGGTPCNNNVVCSNISKNNSADGISISTNASYNIIASNQCFNNTGYGIDIDSSDCYNNLSHGNYLKNNTTGSGRDLGTNTYIYDNVI